MMLFYKPAVMNFFVLSVSGRTSGEATLHVPFRIASIFLLVLLLTEFPATAQRTVASHADRYLTASYMKEQIEFLSSDSLAGRATPGKGLDTAAAYIARQFASFGLKPLNGSYFQPLDYCYVDLGKNLFISLLAQPETINFKLKEDFIPYEISGNKPVEGEVVFAGYGITAPEFGYDDYQNTDVNGKIVVVLRQEPGQTDSVQKAFGGSQVLTRYSGLREKQRNARKHGAIGMLVVSGPVNFSSLKPSGYPWPSLSGGDPIKEGPLVYCSNQSLQIPVVHAGESIIRVLFGSTDSLKRLQLRIEAQMKPQSYLMRGKILAMNMDLRFTPLKAFNVAGFLEGSDERHRNETVIVGAHYDHAGTIAASETPDSDTIFNGADDNASGSAGMLAIARTMASMDSRPKRSVLFIAFAGEELGLLGSSSYVRNPLVPLQKTIAMINLDMIGRNHPDSLQVIGARQNPGLVRIIRKENKYTNMLLYETKNLNMPGGSDHYPFYQNQISSVFFFTGLHEDYHRVSDQADRIDFQKASRVAKLAFLTAWKIANSSGKLKMSGVDTDKD